MSAVHCWGARIRHELVSVWQADVLLEQVRRLLRAADAESRVVGPLSTGATVTLRAMAGGVAGGAAGDGGSGDGGGDGEGDGDEGGGGEDGSNDGGEGGGEGDCATAALATVAAAAAGGTYLAPPLVRFERCRVSVRALRLLELLHEVLDMLCTM